MTDEESEAVEHYLKKYELQIRKQLDALHARIEHLTDLRPVWDPTIQDYSFVEPSGISRIKPHINKAEIKKTMFGWYGNKNNKGKKWPATRRNRKAV